MDNYKILEQYPNYKIYSNGQIWSNYKQGWLKPEVKDYFFVTLSNKDKKPKKVPIHRLVALAFLPNPQNLPVVNHIDENKFNNDVSNLQWVSLSENALHSSYKNHKALIMCDKNTHEEIKRFESRKEALQFLGCPYQGGHFTKVFKGERKSYKGYWWKPAE